MGFRPRVPPAAFITSPACPLRSKTMKGFLGAGLIGRYGRANRLPLPRIRSRGCGRYVSRRHSPADQRPTTTAHGFARPSTVVRLSSNVLRLTSLPFLPVLPVAMQMMDER
jgi:hypothetical protein